MEYICKKCSKTLVDPVETTCCHELRCEGCVDSNHDNVCDLCGVVMTSPPIPNIPIRRIVAALPAPCPYVPYGCKDKLTMGTVREHILECVFGPCTCVWSVRGCAEPIRRKDQGLHESMQCAYRDVKCPQCPLILEQRLLSNHDLLDCPGSMVECPVACGVLIPRATIPDHLSRCRLQPAPCPYRQHGCKAPLMARHQLPIHMSTEVHAHLVLLDSQYAKMQKRLELISAQQSLLPELHRWEPSTIQCIGNLLYHKQSVLSLAVNDGYVFSGGEDGVVVVWDITSGSPLHTFKHLHAVTALFCVGDTVFTGQSDNTIQMWSMETKAVSVSCSLKKGTATDSTGIWKIIQFNLNAVYLSSKPELSALLQHEFDSAGVHSEPLATFPALIVASGDGIIYIVDRQTLTPVDRIEGHEAAVTSLSLMGDDESVLCSSSADGTIRIWDLTKYPPQPVRVLQGHTDSVNSIAFVRPGVLMSGSGDGTVRIWSTTSGECLGVLSGHASGVQCVCRIDRCTVVSGGWDQKMIVWSLDGMKSVSEVTCSMVCAAMKQHLLLVGGTQNSIKLYTAQSLSMDSEVPKNIQTRQRQVFEHA